MLTDNEKLLRYIEGDLSAANRRNIEEGLAEEASLRKALDTLRALHGTLRTTRAESFGPYFSERVMRRLQGVGQAPAESFYNGLQWVFLRTATASLVVAVAFGIYNAITYQSLGAASSFVEAVFGLPSASLMDALSYSIM